jgi:molybdenum cofactor guanylyltransferase
MIPPLYGLVLAGGFSRRMGRDKALLRYHDAPQAVWTARLAAAVCAQVFLSCRRGQDPGATELPRIHDEVEGQGPMGGLLSAHAQHPHAAWLAVACDLPRLTEQTLRVLVDARDPDSLATVYRASRDGLPEPLCALYEPAIMSLFREALANGRHCPRKVILQNEARVRFLDLPDPTALDNINTPEGAQSLASPHAMHNVHLTYFAMLREKAGKTAETVETPAPTLAGLYEELRARYGFPLEAARVRVAVNGAYVPMETAVAEDMAVTFIPPVAGG